MRLPIQYALTYPRRVPSPAQPVRLAEIASLTFEPVDEARFPALAIARRAGDQGPRATAALIAADEVAVERFLAGSLSFPGIWHLAEAAVERFGTAGSTVPGLDEVLALDGEVRAFGRAFADAV